jgi:hypothetical protein
MSAVVATIEHQGVTYAAELVTIRRTELGREDHGIFTAGLHVEFGAGATMIGGHVLDDAPAERDPEHKRLATAYGFQWIIEMIAAVVGEYGKWEDVAGKRVFALYESDVAHYSRAGFNCKGIASLDGDRVMIFDQVRDHA